MSTGYSPRWPASRSYLGGGGYTPKEATYGSHEGVREAEEVTSGEVPSELTGGYTLQKGYHNIYAHHHVRDGYAKKAEMGLAHLEDKITPKVGHGLVKESKYKNVQSRYRDFERRQMGTGYYSGFGA